MKIKNLIYTIKEQELFLSNLKKDKNRIESAIEYTENLIKKYKKELENENKNL